MNQNEALAHKSLARCHAGASQLELWGALLFLHYSQTAAAGGGLVAAVGLLVEPPPKKNFLPLHQKCARVWVCVFSVPVNVCGCSWCRCLGFFWLRLLSASTWSWDLWAAMMSHSGTAWACSGEPKITDQSWVWVEFQTDILQLWQLLYNGSVLQGFTIIVQVLLPSTFTVHCAPNVLISRCTRQLFHCRKKKWQSPQY